MKKRALHTNLMITLITDHFPYLPNLIICFLVFASSLFTQFGFSQQIETIHYTDNQIISGFKGGLDAENQHKDDIVRIIVEFNSIPIAGFLHEDKLIAEQENLRLQELHKQFKNDLNSIAGSNINSDPPEINYTYSKVFAGAAISTNEVLIEAISQLSYVKKIHNDDEYKLDLYESVQIIEADQVWADYGIYGDSIVVGILDSGIDYMHPALGGGIGEGNKVLGGFNFYDWNDNVMDVIGHGTHVAGIVAANGSDIKGVAPHALLYALKVTNTYGSTYASIIVAAVEASVDPNNDGDYSDRLDVVNISLGKRNGSPSDWECEAIENATSIGVTFCISAGNFGEEGTLSISTPGTALSAITVGASDKNDLRATFSSIGPNNEVFSIKPDLLAPGVDIYSTFLENSYTHLSGTSMAAPHVAGVCALLKQLHPEWNPSQLKSALLMSAEDIGDEILKQGAGRLNALKALDLNLMIEPAQLNFGIIDPVIPIYTLIDTLKFTNISDAEQIITICDNNFMEGIQVTSLVNDVQILPGDSVFIPFELSVNNEIVNYPDSAEIAYSEIINLSVNEDTLMIPWSFTKARRLHLVIDGSFKYNIFNEYNYYSNNIFYLYNIVKEYDFISYTDTLNFVAHRYWSSNDVYTKTLNCTGNDTVYIIHDSLFQREVMFSDEAGMPQDYSPFYVYQFKKNYPKISYNFSFTAEDYPDSRFYTCQELSDEINSKLGIFKINEDSSKVYCGSIDLNTTDLNNVIPNEEVEYTKLKIATFQDNDRPIRFKLWHNFANYLVSSSDESFIFYAPWESDVYVMDGEAPNLITAFTYFSGNGLLESSPFQRNSNGIQLYYFDNNILDYAMVRHRRHDLLNPSMAVYEDNETLFLNDWPVYGDTHFYNGLFENNNIYFGTKYYLNNELQLSYIYDNYENLVLNSEGEEVFSDDYPFVSTDLPDDKYTYISNYTYDGFGDSASFYQLSSVIDLTDESQIDIPYKSDNNPPTLTSLQLRNEANRPASHLHRKSSGKLRFSVADFQPFYKDGDSTNIDISYHPINNDSISVFVKELESAEWVQTSFVFLLEDSLIGKYFEVDLSPFLEQVKEISFKLEFSDLKGQRTRHVFEPLFKVSECIPLDDSLNVLMNDTLFLSVNESLLANDGFPDEWMYDIDIVIEDSTLNGILMPNAEGSFIYIPNPGYFGYDSFSYRLKYESILSPKANVSITVDHTTSVFDENLNGITEYSCYPNPFKDKVYFEIRNNGIKQVLIYNSVGILVAELEPVTKDNLKYHYVWDGTNNNRVMLPNGVFYCTITGDNGKQESFKIIKIP